MVKGVFQFRRGWVPGVLTLVAIGVLLVGLLSGRADTVLETVTGDATYYADRFDGRTTASGATFDNDAMLAAHRSWPFGTLVRVTALDSGKSVKVTIADRIGKGSPATIDLSQKAADRLGFLATGEGRIPVRLEVLEWGDSES